MSIKLIVGLRNPGSAYQGTRHNAGAWFVSSLAKSHNVTFKMEKKLQSELATITINQQPCKILLPLTFMNLSGLPIREVSQFYRLQPSEILVAHDELDLDPGRIKLKTGGGHGGHNGLRDIISHIGSEFNRLRIGIGHPGHKDQVTNYVLGKPNQEDKQLVLTSIERALKLINLTVTDSMANAMNILNS